MTDKEKAIVMAYTGVAMLSGDKFSIFHEYIEFLLGRPVFTHELANEWVWNEIKEKSKDDFLKLCAVEEETGAELQAGDIVTTPLGDRAIIIGIEEWNDNKIASIYSEYYALPQMFPVQDLKATGVHKDVRSMLLDLLKENKE